MNNKRFPFYLMVFAVLNFSISTIVLMSIGEYNIYTQFLSALGVREYGYVFNASLVVLALATFLYFWRLKASLRWPAVTASMGVVSSLLLLGIGLFPSGGWTSDAHDVFAILYFLLLIPLYALLPHAFPHASQPPFKILLFLSGYLTSILTIIGLTVEYVNQYIFQKLIVASQLLFLLTSSIVVLTGQSSLE